MMVSPNAIMRGLVAGCSMHCFGALHVLLTLKCTSLQGTYDLPLD